jgi:transposase
MSFQTIVAIDLGKFKSVLCVMDVATRTHRFATIDSTPTAIGQAVGQHVSIDPSQTQVVFETCDTCGWVHDQIMPLGVKIVIVNANDGAGSGSSEKPTRMMHSSWHDWHC